MELENTEILMTESRWFERGVKEAIYIRALNSSLNRDGGQAKERGASFPSSAHIVPMTTAQQETDEADRSQ